LVQLKRPVPVLMPVGHGAVLDSRLALFHPNESWLAVADLHFGYEQSQRRAGALFPLWGMDDVRARLLGLLADHHPQRLIVVGDLLHSGVNAENARLFVEELRSDGTEVVLIRGNHDHSRKSGLEFEDEYRSGRWLFQHGHQATDQAFEGIIVEGHWHPAWVWRDGAGTRLKLPALVVGAQRWILPAFSPWAAGVGWQPAEDDQLFACHPKRIVQAW